MNSNSAARPFGDVNTATVLVIGHDPRLQHSQAQAEVAFFFDYLARPRPTSRSEARKYDLAQATWDYINWLAGYDVPSTNLYVTNLCNEFLAHTPGSGTVLIPQAQAQRGVEQITQVIARGHFKVVLPMAVQTFYLLCLLGFVDQPSDLVTRFIRAARPRSDKAEQGIYQQSGRAPFLRVCGQQFHHHGVPIVPIAHVKQWPLKARMISYAEPMRKAQQNVQMVLRPSVRAE
jgi:hypothetical protein